MPDRPSFLLSRSLIVLLCEALFLLSPSLQSAADHKPECPNIFWDAGVHKHLGSPVGNHCIGADHPGEAEYLQGGDGNDQINARSNTNFGDDNIHGGADNDELHGENGWDVIWAGSGQDLAHGEAGNDDIHLEAGIDTANGDNGQDDIWGGPNPEVGEHLIGNDGQDELRDECCGHDDEKDGICGGNDIDVVDVDDGDDGDTIYDPRDEDAVNRDSGDLHERFLNCQF